MSKRTYIFAYSVGARTYGALVLIDGAQRGAGICADQPVHLAQEIATLWPGLPIYCGKHDGLAVELREWLPDVSVGIP